MLRAAVFQHGGHIVPLSLNFDYHGVHAHDGGARNRLDECLPFGPHSFAT